MAMNKKRMVQVDAVTGEVQEGFTILVPEKRRLRDNHAMMTGQGMLMLALDIDLKQEDWRVLAAYLGSMDFENLIQISQKDLAEMLGMKKECVSRATKKLVSKNILIVEAKQGRSNIYRLNAVFGWKGKITKVYTDLYEHDSKLIA